MRRTKSSIPVERRVLGSETFAAIAAVEGLKLSKASRMRLDSMHERKLNLSEQGAEVIRAYSCANK
jgi:hypothetical protein